jgi:hypothetical protein
MLELVKSVELSLEQNFRLTSFTHTIDKTEDIESLRETLKKAVREIVVKDNMISYLMKQLV